jgi:hypothetical protein
LKQSPSKQSLEIARQYWRTWTLDHLLQDRHNYDFSAIIPWKKAGAEKDIEAAWQIELDRELGLICEPYLTTWERDSLDDIPYPKKLKGLRELFSTQDYSLHSRYHADKKTVMLEIDTNFSILELVDSFHHWLEHHCYQQGANNNFGKGLPGRADIFPGWFKELAIYRCANAGLSRKFGEEHLLVDFLKNLAAAVPTQKTRAAQRQEFLTPIGVMQ